MEVFEVLNSYQKNNEVLSPKSLRTTELEISANFIFSSGERTFSNSAAKHPPASDSALSWTGVKVLSSVTLLPALPQILTIELSLFCPWHRPGRFSVVHSLAPQLWVSRCLWGLPLPPRLSINKCHDGAYGGRCTSMGWQRARAAPRPRRWETTVSLGYRDWEGAPHLGRRTGDASLSFRGWYHTDQVFPAIREKHCDWHQCRRQSHSLCRDLRSPPDKQSWSPVSISLQQMTVKWSLRSNPLTNNDWAPPRHLRDVLWRRSAEGDKKCSLHALRGRRTL